MSDFKSLDLNRKKQLLAILFSQSELINALSEATGISKVNLLFSVRKAIYLQVEEMSEDKINQTLANFENALQQCENSLLPYRIVDSN